MQFGKLIVLALFTSVVAEQISPVQKVVELLDECKAKVAKDLAADAAAMAEYTTYCDEELKAKGYAIQTAEREIGELTAKMADAMATGSAMADAIGELTSLAAAKDKELYEATEVRKAKLADFEAAEKELVTSVDECSRAVTALTKGFTFMQTNKRREAKRELEAVKSALTSVIAAISIDTESTRKLKSFLQSASTDNDDLSLAGKLRQPQAKSIAYESKTGGIIQTVKDMQAKAEVELSDLRKKELADSHEFNLLKQSLEAEISHTNDKLSTSKKSMASATETEAEAKGDLTATTATKAADEEASATLASECALAASEWEAREASAKDEMAAIEKAKEILVGGVVAFAQMSSKLRVKRGDDSDDSDADTEVRAKLVSKIQSLGKKLHSFGLMQLASVASSDPFVKIRGLIEDMIAKLLKEAQEEATQKAFCDQEMGESTKSKDLKLATLSKLQTRIDGASATIAQLEEDVKTLEAEVADIDKSMAEATAIRTKESADNTQAASDFRQSADAVVKAMGVLKNFYGAALLQVKSATGKSTRPSFGSAKSDTGSSIISVLEVAESDFTRLLAETETAEESAAAAFEKMSKENEVSKAAKLASSKAKQSEIKSLTVELGHSKEDHASTSSELDAVMSYMTKLEPQCVEKAMSYAEKKAAREAEIAGLKDALGILEGSTLLQFPKRFQSFRRA